MAERSETTAQQGFTLVEVLAALLVVLVGAVAVADLFTLSVRASAGSRAQTSTVLLATGKLEQLRALTWGLAGAASPVPVTDTTTDLAFDPASSGGRGLLPSPAGSLDSNTPGYVDYLDAHGAWVGTGASPPPDAVFIRRWRVATAPAAPDTLVLQVLVTTVVRELVVGAAAPPRRRHRDDALLTSVRTRKES